MDRQRVLFAVAGDARPSASLLRIAARTQLLGVELHVMCVIPKWGEWRTGGSERSPIQNAAELQLFVATCRSIQHWCRETLTGVLPDDRWEVRSGVFVQEVAKRAAEINAMWICVAPQWQRTGRIVTGLARATRRPVLLSRGLTAGTAILAATDLGDGRYPVLYEAAKLGRQLGRPIIALHNLAPRSFRRVSLPRARVELSARVTSSLRRKQLSNATRRLALDAEMVIANELDAVDAILEQARSRSVDLIVVGTRSHSWFSRTLIGSVSSDLVDRAIRSVLVTPLLEHDLVSSEEPSSFQCEQPTAFGARTPKS